MKTDLECFIYYERGKQEERERIIKEIDKMINFVDVRRANSIFGLEIIKCLKELQKEISDVEELI